MNAKLQSCLRNPPLMLAALSLLASPPLLPAESVPQQINYQGNLVDAAANPWPNGNYESVFRIWDQALTVAGSARIGIENTRASGETISDGCLVEKWIGSTMRRSSLQLLGSVSQSEKSRDLFLQTLLQNIEAIKASPRVRTK